jgi:hypothetical protein
MKDNIGNSSLEELWGGYINGINFDYLTHRLIFLVQVTTNNNCIFYSLEFKQVSEIIYKIPQPLKPRNALELTSIYIDKKEFFNITLDLWFVDDAMKIICDDYVLSKLS